LRIAYQFWLVWKKLLPAAAVHLQDRRSRGG